MRIPLRYSLRNLARRKMRTLLTVLGVALVTAVSVFMFAYAGGVLRLNRHGGSDDTVIALSKTGVTPIFSALKPEEFNRLKELAEVKRDVLGEPMIAPQVVHQVNITAGELKDRSGVARGISPMTLQVNEQIEFTEGEPPRAGHFISVGALAHTAIGVPAGALAIGKKIVFQSTEWTVVGRFTTGGGALDSEVLADIGDMMTAFNRPTYSLALLRVGDPAQVDPLVASLNARSDIRVRASSEREYYAAMSEGYDRIVWLAFALAVISAVGGLVSGMNTMYASVLGRIREIGTLKVLGFRNVSVMAGFLVESMAIASLGGAIGCALAMNADGFSTKYMADAFAIRVDHFALAGGAAVALFIGVFGALPPAIKGIRMRITDALRYS